MSEYITIEERWTRTTDVEGGSRSASIRNNPEERRAYMSKWKHYHVAYHRKAQRDSCIRQNASPLAKKVMENEFERSYVRYAKSKHPQSVRYARWQALGA